MTRGDLISPLLFVIIMEYLHRVLETLALNPNFNFHPKCENMKITNPCFVDDLFLFARGDLESVRVMMNKIRKFTAATGLKARLPKSKIYFDGVEEEIQGYIQEVSGLVIGKFIFKYLGVLLASKKLTISMCEPLTDKMLERLNIGVLDYYIMHVDFNR